MAPPPLPPPSSAPTPPSSSPPGPSSQSDGATLIQEHLDRLALATFNAVLEVSRAKQGPTNDDSHRGKASRLGLEIGSVLREIEEAIETLPVIPPPDGGPSERVNSVVATRKRLKELQAEYERVHRELEETVNEAGRMSAKLRNTLAYNK